MKAREYLMRYEKDIKSERGGVPVELAGVLGVLHSGRPGFFWHIPPAAQERLGVGAGGSPALQLWAGLRLVNEAALLLEQVRDTVRLPRGIAGSEYWAAALRLEALGPRPFVELAHRAGGALALADYVSETDPGDVHGLAEGTIVYRTIAVRSWMWAALELAGSRGRELEPGPGVLIHSRDERVRRIARKASTGGWIASHLAILFKARGAMGA